MRKDFVCQEDINHKKYDLCFQSSGEGCTEPADFLKSAHLSGETPGKMAFLSAIQAWISCTPLFHDVFTY